VAFKAEELTSRIFPEPGTGLWAACPQDTLSKGGKQPCPENTKQQCPQDTIPPGQPCPQDSHKPPKQNAGAAREALALLQGQLRDRLAQL
jgi:hypothetical protein